MIALHHQTRNHHRQIDKQQYPWKQNTVHNAAPQSHLEPSSAPNVENKSNKQPITLSTHFLSSISFFLKKFNLQCIKKILQFLKTNEFSQSTE
jgi:hypothetical protein